MRYADYKRTGTAWISSIPVTWECKKIAALFAQRKGKVSDKDYPALSVAKIGVVPQLESAVKTDAGDNRKLVCAGDFVINSRSDRKGSCGVAQQDGSVSLINIVLTPRHEWNIRYVHYLLRSQPFSEEYYRYGHGIVADLWTTRYSEMKNIILPIPPREEQDQIVRYLDWQVSKINKLVAAKKKQIALLREQKQSIIMNAVFYGINHFAEYQDAKMVFVDRVPAHWQVKRGKYLLAEHDTRSQTGTEELLSVSHITGITPRSQKNITMFKSESLVGYKICAIDDIAANTMWLWQGAIAVSNYHGVISPSYNTYHQICDAYERRYLDYLLRSKPMVDEYKMRSTGIRKSRLRLYPEQFLAMYFPVPPKNEQAQIADYIENRSLEIEQFVSVIANEIDTLHELRNRIISDVVTGQIDVRDIEVPDFDIVEDIDSEEESLDDEDAAEETAEQEE